MSNDKETKTEVSPIERPGAKPGVLKEKPKGKEPEAKVKHETTKQYIGLSDQISEETKASEKIDQLPDTTKPPETKPVIDQKTVEKATGWLGKTGATMGKGFGKVMEVFSKFTEKFAPLLEKITGTIDRVKEQFARSMGRTLVSLEGENKIMKGMRGNLEAFLGIYGSFYKNASRHNIDLSYNPGDSAKHFINEYKKAVTGGVEESFDKFFLGVVRAAKKSPKAKSTDKGLSISLKDFTEVAAKVNETKVAAAEKKEKELAKKEEEKKEKEEKEEETKTT